MLKLLPFISYKIANGSITQKNSENGTAATKNDVDWLIRKQMDSAEFYGQRIINYLIYKTSAFPEYSTNSNSDIDPINNAFNPGIKID